uniref:hypothetical protein n=1 Tax=Polynucleobacter sp. TaxID=2029855 RepID=UPI0040488CF0
MIIPRRKFPKTYKKKVKKPYRKATLTRYEINKAVKAVVNRGQETKHSGIDETEYVFESNYAMSTPINLAQAMNISNGTTDGARVGNNINVTKATLNIVARRNNTSASRFPAEIHVFIGYVKQDRSTIPGLHHLNRLYEDGAAALPWNGTQLRTLRAINKTIFTMTNKLVFKVGSSDSFSVQQNNNDFSLIHRAKVELKAMHGKVIYGDDGQPADHNKDLWMFASYCYIDDNTDNLIDNPTSKPVDLLYFVDLQYKDA